MENGPFEDIFPLENVIFQPAMLGLPEGKLSFSKRVLPLERSAPFHLFKVLSPTA